MQRFLFIVLSWVLVQQGLAQDQKWSLNSSKSIISYSANHVLHPWEATTKKAKGVVVLNPKDHALKELAVLTLVRDFDSKNTSRDAHALEVLEALTFPQVRFYANLIEEKTDSLLLHGQLDFHGVIKNHTIVAHQQKSQNELILTGEFNLKPTDFGITLPSFMMIKMDDLLSFTFELDFSQ